MRRGLGLGLVRNRGNSFARFDDFLLRDDFLTAESAPLASPRTCEPGPGSLNLVQVDGQFSISDEKLNFPAQATPTWDDLRFYSITFIRSCGLALLANKTISTLGDHLVGWSNGVASTSWLGALYFALSTGNIRYIEQSFPYAIEIDSVFSLGDYKLEIIMRSTGFFVIINNKIMFIDDTAADSPIAPFFLNRDSVGTIEYFRVSQLGAPWDSDYGIATDRLAGARSPGDTFIYEVENLIEFTVTTAGGAIAFIIRALALWTDLWQIYVYSTGKIDLSESVGGSFNVRGSAAAGTVTSGDRILIVCYEETINIYVENSLVITYASAASLRTVTNGVIFGITAPAVVSDIVTWPRVLSGAALTEILKFTT